MNLDAQFAFLDDLPESLYSHVVTLHHGSLRERVEGILVWRHALLRGELPRLSHIHWPERSLAETLLMRLDALDLVSLCRNEEALVDHILKDICTAVASILRRKDQGIDALFDDIVANQQAHEAPSSQHENNEEGSADKDGGAAADDGSGGVSAEPEGSAATASADNSTDASAASSADSSATAGMPQAQAEKAAPAAETDHSISAFTADEGLDGDAALNNVPSRNSDISQGDELMQHWQQLLEHWRETSAVFQGMGSRLGRGWDLSNGDLHSTDWRRFVAYRKLIRRNPQLQAIVDSLGRDAEAADDDGPVAETADADSKPGEALAPMARFVHSESPLSTAGISRSDDIARMLPQEAAFLGHPRLKMLWHARRAEHGLLSYQVEGVLSEHRPEPLQQILDHEQPRPQREKRRGPLIVCLDSSASMHGETEDIAKAVCLEVLRLANETDRPCHLFAFSGPGQVIELQLQFDPPGLRNILRFLAQSFYGGTDIRDPVLRALDKLQHPAWKKADMLLISDGRFPVPDAVMHAVRDAREKYGLQLLGLTLGRWSSSGLEKICQPVHRFQLPSALAPFVSDQ